MKLWTCYYSQRILARRFKTLLRITKILLIIYVVFINCYRRYNINEIQRFLKTEKNRHEKVADSYKDLLLPSEASLEYLFESDGYYDGALFEFKWNDDNSVKALAQSCYYVKRFIQNPPDRIVICHEDKALICPIELIESFINDSKYNWKCAPSVPDQNLCNDLKDTVDNLVKFDMTKESDIKQFTQRFKLHGQSLKIQITIENYIDVFSLWTENIPSQKFAADEPQATALMFIMDLQNLGRIVNNKIEFIIDDPTRQFIKHIYTTHVAKNKHNQFWSSYNRNICRKVIDHIMSFKYRLIHIAERKADGEFFTRVDDAGVSWQLLETIIPDCYNGKGPHHSLYDEFLIIDPCGGNANLLMPLPKNSKGKVWMTTLYQTEIDIAQQRGLGPNVKMFAMDFLSNMVNNVLKSSLDQDLKNAKKVAFVMNPPYMQPTGSSTIMNNTSTATDGKSKTHVQSIMKKAGLGRQSTNLTNQFLFKIIRWKEISDWEEVYIMLFSRLTPFISTLNKPFSDYWEKHFIFQKGFVLNAKRFGAGDWPIFLTIWKSKTKTDPSRNDIIIPDFQKLVKFERVQKRLFDWADISTTKNKICPGLRSSMKIKPKKQVLTSYDSIGYVVAAGDLVLARRTAWLQNLPHDDANGWIIEPKNFEKSVVAMAVRRLDCKWINDQCEYSAPNEKHPEYDQFVKDIIVWSTFSTDFQHNISAQVQFQNKPFDIPNEFFWMTKDQIMSIPNLPLAMYNQCSQSKERFVADWIEQNFNKFSKDIQTLIKGCRKLVEITIKDRMIMHDNHPELQLDRWDAGWHQLQSGLFNIENKRKVDNSWVSKVITINGIKYDLWKECSDLYEKITTRLDPYVYKLGFLSY